jgi:DNA (cytosine-5)-methyltransferase 1
VAPTVLSLCSGYGGLELAVHTVWAAARVAGYVEWDAYAAAVLLARMEDASLAPAPIWCGDLAELPAAPFLGVDLVTAGFPCQPWSAAAVKGLGAEDERWIWPDIAVLLRQLGPRLVFLENVPPLVARGGLELVLGDLATLGFDAEWTVLRASDVGAPHQRERVFVLAHAHDGRLLETHSDRGGRPVPPQQRPAGESGLPGDVANGNGAGRSVIRSSGLLDPERAALGYDFDGRYFPPGPSDDWSEQPSGAQPSLCRGTDGAAHWLGTAHASTDDQLRLLGNGVVPAQAAAALRLLLERFEVV